MTLQDGQMRPRAGRTRRLKARAIDLFLRAIALFVAFWFFFASLPEDWFVLFRSSSDEAASRSPFQWAALVVTIMICLLVLLYHPVMTGIWGQTFGKAMLGVCVVSHIDGLDPLLSQALVRWLVPTIAGGVGGMAALMVSGNSVGDLPDRGLTALVLGAALPWTVVHVSSLWDPDGRGWPDKAAGTAVISA